MSYFKEAVGAIEKFSERFRENPWNYLYEADVQFELMQCLKEKITSKDLAYDSHEISAVKSEYPGVMELDVGNRFDLVVIDPKESSAHICNRPVSIAMELKLNVDEKNIGDYIYNKYKCTVEKDIDKLSDGFKRRAITTAGFAILCVKPYETGMDKPYEMQALEILNDPRFKLSSIHIEDETAPTGNQKSMGTYVVVIGSEPHYFKLNGTV